MSTIDWFVVLGAIHVLIAFVFTLFVSYRFGF